MSKQKKKKKLLIKKIIMTVLWTYCNATEEKQVLLTKYLITYLSENTK